MRITAFFTAVATAAATAIAGTAWALTPPTRNAQPVARSLQTGATSLTTAREKADARIDRVMARITAAQKVLVTDGTDPGMSALGSRIDVLKSELGALKTQIGSASTLHELRMDMRTSVGAMQTDGAVAQLEVAVRVRRATLTLDRLDARWTEIEKAAGSTDPATVDVAAKVAEARSVLSELTGSVASGQMSPAAAKAALKEIASDLAAIRRDMKSIRSTTTPTSGGGAGSPA